MNPMSMPTAPWGSNWNTAAIGTALMDPSQQPSAQPYGGLYGTPGAPLSFRQRIGGAIRGLAGNLDPTNSPTTSPLEALVGGASRGYTGAQDAIIGAAAAPYQAQYGAQERMANVGLALAKEKYYQDRGDYYADQEGGDDPDPTGGMGYELYQHPGLPPSTFNRKTGALHDIPGASTIPFASAGSQDDTPPEVSTYRGVLQTLTDKYAGQMNEATGKPYTSDDIAGMAEAAAQGINPKFRRPNAGPTLDPATRAAQLRDQGLGADAIRAQMGREGYRVK